MLAHEVGRGAADWAAVRVGGASWEDLDPLEFERLRQLASSSGTGADAVLASSSDREIASALGLVRADADVTAGALLLFGKSDALRRFLPTHEAAFQVLAHCSRTPSNAPAWSSGPAGESTGCSPNSSAPDALHPTTAEALTRMSLRCGWWIYAKSPRASED
jgi:hypothetical protein